MYCWEKMWAVNLCCHVRLRIHVYTSALTIAGAGWQTAFSQAAEWPWKLLAWPQSVLTCRDESGASWLIFASIDEIIDVAYRNPDPKIWKEVKCHFSLSLSSSIGFTPRGVWQVPITGWTLVVLDPAPALETRRTDLLFLQLHCVALLHGTEHAPGPDIKMTESCDLTTTFVTYVTSCKGEQNWPQTLWGIMRHDWELRW